MQECKQVTAVPNDAIKGVLRAGQSECDDCFLAFIPAHLCMRAGISSRARAHIDTQIR